MNMHASTFHEFRVMAQTPRWSQKEWPQTYPAGLMLECSREEAAWKEEANLLLRRKIP